METDVEENTCLTQGCVGLKDGGVSIEYTHTHTHTDRYRCWIMGINGDGKDSEEHRDVRDPKEKTSPDPVCCFIIQQR